MREENSLMEEAVEQEEQMLLNDETAEQAPEQEPAKEDLVEESGKETEDNDALVEETEEEIVSVEIPVEEDAEMPVEPETEPTPTSEVQEDAPAEEETEPKETQKAQQIPYHERYYLRYREGKRSAALDLDGTKAFLQELGFDGGELRQAREGKDRAESFRGNEGKGNQMRCSYCGAEISGVEFYRLPDGRMRCTTCSSTVVKNKTEMETICRRVLDNLDNFFGATIDVPVDIEVTDERKLKKKLGIPLGTRDSQSILILGVAINKKKKYSIILENGAPRISLIATFAHELTHIWQYTHWDNKKNFKKCPKSKRLLVYEGMAKWVEIQYLYLIGETKVAEREEMITRERQDEYGIGFCLYEDRYPLTREAMSCEETPFTKDCYPL